LIANTNVRVGSKVQAFRLLRPQLCQQRHLRRFQLSFELLQHQRGLRARSFDTRNRLFFGGSFGLPYNFRLSPFMIASSGSPFNITTTNDLNNDSIFNDRPGFVSAATCPTTVNAHPPHTYCTPLGTFDARARRWRKDHPHQLRHWSIACSR
jgi:hypothetical protein